MTCGCRRDAHECLQTSRCRSTDSFPQSLIKQTKPFTSPLWRVFVQPLRISLQILKIKTKRASHRQNIHIQSNNEAHSSLLNSVVGRLLTTWQSAVTNAWGTLHKEPLPASVLLLTVVDLSAALFWWAEVAFICTGGVACPVQFPLIDFDASPLAHT